MKSAVYFVLRVHLNLDLWHSKCSTAPWGQWPPRRTGQVCAVQLSFPGTPLQHPRQLLVFTERPWLLLPCIFAGFPFLPLCLPSPLDRCSPSPAKKRSAPVLLHRCFSSSGHWVPSMSCQTGGMSVNPTLMSGWKVGTGRRGKCSHVPLKPAFPRPDVQCILWMFLFFFFHTAPHPTQNSQLLFSSFAGTVFCRMSWCILYCTCHSGFQTAADIISKLKKVLLEYLCSCLQ